MMLHAARKKSQQPPFLVFDRSLLIPPSLLKGGALLIAFFCLGDFNNSEGRVIPSGGEVEEIKENVLIDANGEFICTSPGTASQRSAAL